MWSGVGDGWMDTPQTVMTTRAPAVLTISHDIWSGASAMILQKIAKPIQVKLVSDVGCEIQIVQLSTKPFVCGASKKQI